MMRARKNSLSRADSITTLDAIHTSSPLRASLTTDPSDILSAAVLHKRRPQKRVRFALKLEPVEEHSSSSSRETSASIVSKSSSRIIDPWRQDGLLYGTHVEYLEKQDGFISHSFHTRRTPPPPPPPAPEPGAVPPTYTHTFVIQSKSPEVVIDSITVSTPAFHLPRILCHQPKKTNKNHIPAFDSYVKQQLTLSTSPRITHSKKLTNASHLTNPYASAQAALKRVELTLPSNYGLHINNKVTRVENSSGPKLINSYTQPKKITEIITRPLPGVNNQLNHFSDHSILPNYSTKPRMHNRTPRPTGEMNANTPYFCQNHDDDQLSQPVLYFTR